ncbi:MAG: hypothetical protein ACRC3B_18725 [Bacteroidia bacterium]
MAISYSACHESKADKVNDSPVSVVNKDIQRYEEKIKEMTVVHEEQVKNYTNEVGMTSNSTALEMIQEHKMMLEKHQGRLDYHRLQLLHGDTTDSVKTNKMLSELNTDLEAIAKDIEKMSADAASESSLNIRK